MANRSALIRLARSSAKATARSASASAASCLPAINGIASRAASPHLHSHRSFSSNVTPAAADRRIAGRRRFYEHVGIKPCSPPDRPEQNNGNSAQNGSVGSPISAGVDGTQSATGVATTVSDPSLWSSLLQPKSSSSPAWHTVTLDGRALRTSLGLPLTLPSLTLALAVASEWDAQRTHLRPAQMPLMTLCCTAIDQVASDPSTHRAEALRFLRNDTSCYRACPTEDRVLHRKQSQAWDGLHSTLSEELLGLPSDVRPAVATGGGEALLLSRSSKGNSNSGLPHPPILAEKAKRWVEGLDAWTLTALCGACSESKSFFIGAALIREARKGATACDNDEDDGVARDGRWAAAAARVEEEFNIECWGLVEGGHDYDRLNCSVQMHAASLLARVVANSDAS